MKTIIKYEQAYQENLDITFIMKYTDTERETKIEVSGFYYGEPNEEDFEIFKDSGTTAVVDFGL